MRIANIMLSSGAGGIEQAMADYCRALLLYTHDVMAVTPPHAWVNERLPAAAIHYPITNWGEWDRLAAWRLRRLLLSSRPDAVITHTNRALSLTVKAVKGRMPIIAVAHNYSLRRCVNADALFAITQDVARQAIRLGMKADTVFHIPNMVETSPLIRDKTAHAPPVIGVLGRFVAKKGFDLYLRALKILKDQAIAFKAVIGGKGEEEARLRALSAELGLQECVDFIGWVDDRAGFYDRLDLFCLPSRHEPFGIVLLEAFAHGVPVVSTATEGPMEIITPGKNAILVEKDNPAALAEGLRRLLHDEALRQTLSADAYHTVSSCYSHQAIGERIDRAVKRIMI